MSVTRFHVLTLFPEMIMQGLNPSVIGRAVERDIISLDAVNIRDYTLDRHGKVDDYPYGGGAGMLIQAQPVYDAHRAVTQGRAVRTIYVTPQGTPFSQKIARELADERELVFLCGHYEGIDERVLGEIVTDSISIGDYVLTGGELPAMVMIDAIARLIPGVLGNGSSAEEESFFNDLLEYPQYSRPEVWHGGRVPEVLLSGDHRRVMAWRLEQSKQRTQAMRPDLYEKYEARQRLVRYLSADKRNNIHMMEGLSRGRYEVLHMAAVLASDEKCESPKKRAGRKKYREQDILLYESEYKICMILAADALSGEHMAEMLPADAELAVTSQSFLRDILSRKGYRVSDECVQVLYTKREALPVKHKDIRRLTMDYYDYIREHYCVTGEDGYIRERIRKGAMYGAFSEDTLVGFIGMHSDGCLGMLYVEEAFRRQGIARSLEAYAVNRMLERGWTPYAYISVGNEASEDLQEKLGFYKAQKTFWWLEKTLANMM